ncbi:5068_t:CDS:2, partial [Ambispora leptoticha]
PSISIWIRNWNNSYGNRLIAEQLAWNYEDLQIEVNNRILHLNTEQFAAYNAIYNSVTNSYGIASLLLSGGHTAHSTFKIPIDVNSNSFCSIDKTSEHADLLRQTALIIWDEVSMQNRYCAEAVDYFLHDIHDNQHLFGGITVVFGGDFHQILPVVVKGSREQIVGACLQRSQLW